MDQADRLRELFDKKTPREKLIHCRDRVREAIRLGNQADIEILMAELEQAQIEFEKSNLYESVSDTG
ncbi:hypothetical protein C9J01_03485 [Photobacterium rosenbergii]|uniref:Uncharacterized protein n=1 Tax=Photobacterium rosenbergii TaxID=294936 RepID=A0A2T3NKQ1_9GAMM|nr:hypothetical protein [Photobacterium rosenbergii]PSW16081.1 hypothetical protein C9J01_03485 [Photobacterium rosenbergii]